MKMLKVGDSVYWSGCFGTEAFKTATVTAIEVTEEPREKYGVEVDEVEWNVVAANCAVVTLSNGHWAYGEQIAPIPF